MSSNKQSGGQRASGPPNDWRVYRPAIWLAMLGVAVILLVNPAWIGAAPIGAAIGVALKIRRRRSQARVGS
jgi:hypothetical protein